MSRRLTKALQLLITLLIPILIILTAARFLATDRYLAFEYSKASFPPDSFGFTDQQRFILASTNIHYVRAHLTNNELSKQILNGVPVYTAREVSHMADVQAVFQVILKVWWGALLMILWSGFVLWRYRERIAFASAIRSGGLLTSAMILSIALLAVFAWQFWFNTFHLIFFKPGSWLFSYSDALIRLFPVKFWFDATLTISVLSFGGGLLMILIGRQWRIAVE